jgi:hypothetical protein
VFLKKKKKKGDIFLVLYIYIYIFFLYKQIKLKLKNKGVKKWGRFLLQKHCAGGVFSDILEHPYLYHPN